MRTSYAWLACSLCIGGLAVGCGAKTGLRIPDASPDTGVDAAIPCVEVPPDGGVIELPLETQAELGRADIAFVIDTTGSMGEEINQIRSRLRDEIAPAVESEIPDAAFAVATFADFPMNPFGDAGDEPFALRLPMTTDLTRLQAAVNGIELESGQDEPESQVEALYQMATGEGLSPYIPSSFGCPRGGFGYACFRTDALPIILLFTDAPMHNGPGGSQPYTDTLGAHTFEEAIRELTERRIHVIGFDSGEGAGRLDLEAAASRTGAVASDGRPLVFDIGGRGERLGRGVIEAMKTFAEASIIDIDAVLSDPVPDDGVDVLDFVDAISPLRAEPMTGIDSIDTEAGVFRGVRSGTRVIFQLRLRNDAVVPGPTARRFVLEVMFRADGRTRLGAAQVEIVIPGADGVGCEG